MAGGDVVPLPLGGEVVEDGGVEPAHPVVGIRAMHAVRDVLVRLLGRDGRAGRGRHRRHRTPRSVARRRWSPAGRAALGAARSATPVAPAPATAPTRSTFTVGVTGDVDSFNPFLGFEANSYEMWALIYDYMVGYSMKDMSPTPALADERGRPPTTA